ncbi:MAG: MFS transporter [Anaerolineales bacterium]|nr:MFS transporter [Anaerolineales bacterium]
MTEESKSEIAGQVSSALISAEIDEALDTGQVVTISAGHAIHDTYTAFLPPLLPGMIERFVLSNAQAGLLSAFLQIPSLFQPVIGHLADRSSLRYLVILAPGVSATLMSLLGIAPGYWWAALLLFLAGLSSASLHAVGPVMAGRVSGDRLGRGMSYWMVGGELGRTLGPILIVSAIGLFSLRGLVWMMFGGWAASLLLFVQLRKIPVPPLDDRGNLPWKEAIVKMHPFLIALAGLQIVRSFSSVALTTYLPLYLEERGASLFWAGASLSTLEAAGVAGALAGGSFSDRLGRRRILGISMVATSGLIVIFLFLNGWWQRAILPLLGFASLSMTPVIMATVQECYPENRALANGVYMALSFVIRSIILVVFGGISDLIGLKNSYFLSAILLLGGLFFLPAFPIKRDAAAGA